MATSSISTSFDITKKSSAKSFVIALTASPVKKETIVQRPVLVSKKEAVCFLKKKAKNEHN